MEHEDYNGCYCARCLKENDVTIGGSPFRDCRMILCQVCGNKRCPKATDCRLECTGSNAPGQKGSSCEAIELAEIGGEPALRAVGPIAWERKMGSQTEITPEIRRKLDDALSVIFDMYVEFEDRHAIDRKFNPGDCVSVVGVPEIRGRVESVHPSDSAADSMAIVTGIPDYTHIIFAALEHAPDDDGVTRYHTETGEVLAESDPNAEYDPALAEGLKHLFKNVVESQKQNSEHHESFNRLFVAFVAVTVMALASLSVNVYLVMGGAR